MAARKSDEAVEFPWELLEQRLIGAKGAIEEWLEYKKEDRNEDYTRIGMRALARKCNAFQSVSSLKLAIYHAIETGWQGFYAVREDTNRREEVRPRPPVVNPRREEPRLVSMRKTSEPTQVIEAAYSGLPEEIRRKLGRS